MESGEATVDLERQVVAFDGHEGGREFHSRSTPRSASGSWRDWTRSRLTLGHVDEIAHFEQQRQEIGALTTKI